MYWEREQEVYLLTAVLEALDPEDDAASADRIVGSLIEMGLVDMDRAPAAQQAWQDEWDGFDVTHEFVVKHYVTPDDEDYDED